MLNTLYSRYLGLFLWAILGLPMWGNTQDNTEQDPYLLAWSVEAPIATIGLGSGIAYLAINPTIEPLSEAYIRGLDRSTVSAFDRLATYNWSPTIARVSDGVMAAGIALPFILLAQKDIRKTAPKIGVLYAETFVAAAGLTNFTKIIALRPRPFIYNEQVPLHEKIERDAQYSFFSGHTSVTTAMCFLTAKIFHDYNPGHPARPWVWAGAATFSATAGILRYQAGKHFWTDILTGYAFGAAIGILIPELHNRNWLAPQTIPRPVVEF